MKTTIFANGNILNSDINLSLQAKIIAADGGARHCLAMDIIPHVVIGDFDSLAEDQLADLESFGATLIRYPVEKDETDLELALNYALQNGATDVTLLGLLGGRWDMSFANLLLLASPSYKAIRFHIIDDNSEMFVLRGGSTLDLIGQPEDTVSVIPLSPVAQGISYSGLVWPLENASIVFGSTRGVSNRLLQPKARISLDSGILLVILSHEKNAVKVQRHQV